MKNESLDNRKSTLIRPRNFDDILSKFPDARKNGGQWIASCPVLGHKTPRNHLTLTDAGDKALVKCFERHTYEEICQHLGFESLNYNGDGEISRPAAKRPTTTRYSICDSEGQVRAVHIRRDGSNGKTMAWELADGRSGLGGLRLEGLPLYGVERLEALPDGAIVVVTEGEKAAKALLDKGIPAVGTVTGAGGTPGLEALRPLVRFTPILWEDNDEAGRGHMSRIASRLYELECPSIRVVSWPDAPPGGDAADATGMRVDIGVLLEQSQEREAPPREDLAELLSSVEEFIRRYVATGDTERAALTLWVAHTHTFEAAECTPYLQVTSPEKQSGKTRLLETLDLVAWKAWFTSRVSAAALVRKVARDVPALLLDETDSAFKVDKEYSEALRSILNSGYRYGGMACLCVKQAGDFELAELPTFCPKALAGIGELPDTVADRSIRISLKRRAPSETVERFRLRTAKAQAAPLRECLERWANAAVAKLTNAEPVLPEGLSDRACDVWEPLLAIADFAGGVWPARARESAIVLSTASLDNSYSLGVRLLHDTLEVLRGMTTPIPTAALLEKLVTLDEAPWGDLKGNPLDARRLARILKPYGIKPHVIRIGDTTPRGYEPGDFQDAWERYCAYTPEISATSATSATENKTKYDSGEESVADVADVAAPGGIHGRGETIPLPLTTEEVAKIPVDTTKHEVRV